jgi:hypothetical protein
VRRASLLIATLALGLAGAAVRPHVRAAGVLTPAALARPCVLYAPPIPSPTSVRKIDEYGDLRWSDEKARLDNFVIELKNDPDAVGYIIGYAGRVARVGDARRRIDRARNYVVSVRKINPRDVVTIDGGHKEDLTVELYVLPRAALPPQATPTVDPSEVRLIKRSAKRRRR